MSGKTQKLPCEAELLVPQRPPMMVIDRLLERDPDKNFSVVAAEAPVDGIFNPDGKGLIPEYFIELIAQSMAAVNGFDSIVEGKEKGIGFLVGVDDFRWFGPPVSLGDFRVEVVKNFEFGQVTVMSGKVLDSSGNLLACGEIKAWEA